MKRELAILSMVIFVAGCGSSRYLLNSNNLPDNERACLSVNGAIDIITVNGAEVNIIGNKTVHMGTDVYLPAGNYNLGVKYHTGSGRYSSGIIPLSKELCAGKKYSMRYYEEAGLVHIYFVELVEQ